MFRNVVKPGCCFCVNPDVWVRAPGEAAVKSLPASRCPSLASVRRGLTLLPGAVVPGEPRAPHRAAAMLKQTEPSSSTLQLVASDMSGIMEKLDTHELDLDDGEYDTTDTGAPGAPSLAPLGSAPSFSLRFLSPFPRCAIPQPDTCPSPPSTTRWASRSPRPKSSCRLLSRPGSWRWSASPPLRTAFTPPRRGASTR